MHSLQHDRIHSNLSIVRVGRGSDFELIKILGQGQFPYSKHFHCSEDKGQRGQWPKLSYIGKFFLLLLSLLICPSTPFEAENPASKLKSQSWGSNPSLKAQIPVSRLKSQSQGTNSSPEAKMPVSRLKSQSWGLRLKFQSGSWYLEVITNLKTSWETISADNALKAENPKIQNIDHAFAKKVN